MLRSILYLVGGVGGAQLLNLIASPVLSRLYSPHDFGVMGIYVSLVLLFGALSSLSLHFALPVEKNKEDAKVLLSLSGLLPVVFLILGFITVSFLYYFRFDFDFDLEALIFLLPVSILFMAYQGVFEQWNSRNEKHSVTAAVAFGQSFLVNLLKILFGVLGFSYGLVLGQSFLGVVGALVCVWYIHKHGVAFDYNKLRESFSSNIDYVLYRTPQVLLSSFAQALPVLVFGMIYEPDVVGFFVLAKAIVSAPALLLGNAVGNVLAPKLGAVAGDVVFAQAYRKPMLYMFLAGLPCVVAFFFVAEWLFSFVYGQEWREAGAQAAWLSVWYLAFMVVRPAIVAIAIVGVQKELLLVEVLMLALKAISLYIGYLFDISAINALAIYSVINVLHYFSMPLLVERKLRSDEKEF